MDTLTIVIGTVAVAVLMGLAWIGGYEIGTASGANAERELANRRVNGVLDAINNRKPKAAKNKRKAARKAVRA
jgi:hypothetical protein